MKIRIKGNSLRLRLSQSDVHNLKLTGQIIEKTQFVNSCFIYKLLRSDENPVISASFKDGTISVFLPADVCDSFVSTQQIGCNGELYIDDTNKLSILVEKDFKCLDNSLEDQSDNYPNPLAGEYGA